MPDPVEGQTQAEVMELTARSAANKLLQQYQSRIYGNMRMSGALGDITMAQALTLYASDYLADRSTNADTRNAIRNQLNKISAHLGNKRLKDLKVKDLRDFVTTHKSGNGLVYIREFSGFLVNTAHRLGVEVPAKEVMDRYLRAMQNQNHPKQIMRQQRKVANCNVLPAQYEQKLDEGCWSNLGDPLWAAIVMVKEGGLTPKVVCALRNKDIVAFGPDEDEVYVSYRRDDLASYTHDYTFPLTPFGGRYITLWLQHLKNNMPTDRTDGEKYLFSADDHGNVPLNASELHKFIYCQLNRYIFGYAGRVKLGALMISPSVKLLHNTREKHIREDCRFGTDTGAINFLLHRSLVNQVQADHYRCFVDETGRRSLWLRLCQTRHGLPPETPRRTRMSTIQRNGMIELHFPAKITDPGRDKLITVSLEGLIAGEVIVVKTRHGCYINTINQDGSTTSFAGGTTDSDDERAPGTP